MEEILNCRTPHGEMCFWWLGQMGYIVRLGGVTLMIDGYLSENPARLRPALIRPEELRGIDYILGSHDHEDHIDRDAWRTIARCMPRVQFVAPSVLIEALARDLDVSPRRFVGINEGTRALFTDDLTIEGVASAHETLDPDPRTGEYPYTGFVIEGNGMRVYHSGDCVTYDGLERKLLEKGPFDVAFLPINGRDGRRYRTGCIGNMTFQEAVSLTCNLRPSMVVPGHYDMFEGNTADPRDFTDYLDARAPSQRCWVGERGECVRCASARQGKTAKMPPVF